ncbi:hypothetical protein Pelo_19415 [Pelomyxa schiedti]|nr:hypothetical protein Pelo_19415 [Pelomyxa schiedti]
MAAVGVSRVAKEFQASFGKVQGLPYKEQACFFMNAFWADCAPQVETIWQNVASLCKLDENGVAGHSVDEIP